MATKNKSNAPAKVANRSTGPRGGARNGARGSTRLGRRLVAGLTEVRDALASGRPLEERFTIRTVRMPDEPSEYLPQDIKRLREQQLNVSQAVFARLLGVSAPSVRAWESRGRRRVPPPTARRLLDLIRQNPAPIIEMIQPKREPARNC